MIVHCPECGADVRHIVAAVCSESGEVLATSPARVDVDDSDDYRRSRDLAVRIQERALIVATLRARLASIGAMSDTRNGFKAEAYEEVIAMLERGV